MENYTSGNVTVEIFQIHAEKVISDFFKKGFYCFYFTLVRLTWKPVEAKKLRTDALFVRTSVCGNN